MTRVDKKKKAAVGPRDRQPLASFKNLPFLTFYKVITLRITDERVRDVYVRQLNSRHGLGIIVSVVRSSCRFCA